MNRGSIPENQQLAGNMALEVFEKLYYLQAFDTAGVKLEIELPENQAANEREAFPIEGFLQQWGLPARRPSPCSGRLSAEAAFIDKDNQTALPLRFFFNAGHFVRFHCRTACSSRSMALRSGR